MRVDASLSLGNHGVFFIRSSEEGEGEHSHPSMGEHYGRDHPYIMSVFLFYLFLPVRIDTILNVSKNWIFLIHPPSPFADLIHGWSLSTYMLYNTPRASFASWRSGVYSIWCIPASQSTSSQAYSSTQYSLRAPWFTARSLHRRLGSTCRKEGGKFMIPISECLHSVLGLHYILVLPSI